jgi:hypothetical protein
MHPGDKRYPARRWVVERALTWRSTCRGLLMRDETKAVHNMGLRLHVSVATGTIGVTRRGGVARP